MSEEEMMAALKNIQQQLVFLERKLDKLLHQAPQRPPFRSFNKTDQPSQGFGQQRSFAPRGNFAPKGNFAPRNNFSDRSQYPPKRKPYIPKEKDR